MAARIELKIERLQVGVIEDRAAAERVGKTVEEALRRLAERLQGSPVSRFERAGDIALEALELDGLSLDELTGRGGAERLADELYTAITRRFP